MNKRKEFTLGTLAAVPALLAMVLVSPPVSLGNVELEGGSESVEVDTDAIPAGTDGPEMVGQITNKTGRPMTDVTVSVKRTSPNNTPPTSGGSTTVSNTEGSCQSSGANTTTSEGYSATIQFGGGGGCGDVANNGTMNVDVNVDGTGSGSTIKVWFTPSFDDKPNGTSSHADGLETYSLTETAPGATHSLDSPYHDRGCAFVTNAGADKVVSFAGTCVLPAGVSLSSVHLEDPSMAYATVAGTTVQITGNSFTITGFAALQPGATYDLITVFSGVPTPGYRITLDATFGS